MGSTDPSPGTPPVAHPATESLHDRWTRERARLLACAGAVDTLTDTVRLVDRALAEATSLVDDARLEANTLRAAARDEARALVAAARRDADAMLADARHQVSSLLAEMAELDRELGASPAAIDLPASGAVAAPASPPTPIRGPAALDAGSAADGQAGIDDHDLQVDPPAARGAGRRFGMVGIAAILLAAGAWWWTSSAASDAPRRVTSPPSSGREAPLPSVQAASAPDTDTTSSPEATLPAAPEGVTVALRAERNVWIRTAIDGVLGRGGFLAAGERRVLTGKREIEVRTGNGGVLFASVNGGPEAPLGRKGTDARGRWSSADLRAAPRAATPSGERVVDEPSSPAREHVATSGTDSQVDPPPDTPASRGDVLEATRRWFDAWSRGDDVTRHGLQATEFEMVDQRGPAERRVSGQSPTRDLRSIQVDTWGDHAAAAGVLAEQPGDGAVEVLSVFAATWVKRDGRWQLMGMRLNSPAS